MSKYHLVRHNPFTLKSSINELFDDFFTLPTKENKNANYMQNILLDVTEDENAYNISADMAGVNEKDISVELDKHLLTVKAKREHKHKDKKHHLQECYYGEYQRAITLPENIDSEKVEAKYENGVLNITVPKTTKSDTVKKITITS